MYSEQILSVPGANSTPRLGIVVQILGHLNVKLLPGIRKLPWREAELTAGQLFPTAERDVRVSDPQQTTKTKRKGADEPQ